MANKKISDLGTLGAGFAVGDVIPIVNAGVTYKISLATALGAYRSLASVTPVTDGGTGQIALVANGLLVGNGSGAVQSLAPLTTGNILRSNGTGWFSTPLSGRNFLVNGNFNIWSRDVTGLTGIAIEVMGPDRWFAYQNVSAVTWTRNIFVNGQTEVPNQPAFYATVTVAAGGNGFYLGQKIDFVRTLADQQITVSLWIRGSVAAIGTLVTRQNFMSSAVVITSGAAGGVNITTAWTKHTVTLTIPSIFGKIQAANNNFQIGIESVSVTPIVLDIAQAQVELGAVATTFEQIRRNEDQTNCQRFLPAYEGLNYMADGGASTALNAIINFKWLVTPRIAPTGIVATAAAGFQVTDGAGAVVVCTALTFVSASLTGGTINATVAAGLTVGRQSALQSNLSTSRIYFTGAEL